MINTYTNTINTDLQKILSQWGLTFSHFEKIRDVYKVYTPTGIKNLKFSPLIPARVLFVHNAVQHLINNGFTKMYPLIPTLQRETMVCDQQYAYCLFDWIDGRQCNYRNKPEILQSMRVLAEFHEKSCGFIPPEHSNMRNLLGKCLRHFEERYQDLLCFKETAADNLSDPFAKVYLANVDDFLAMAAKAITKIKNSAYLRLVERALDIKSFCHGDPAARNFIVSPDGKMYIIDFDSCRLDLPIMDLIKYLRRVMKKYRWHYPTAKYLIDAYQEINPLTSNELAVIKAAFFFPQKFWRLSNRYFDQRATYGPERLLHKFQKYVGNKNYMMQFQEQFANYQPRDGE